jgi:hypothetical protein
MSGTNRTKKSKRLLAELALFRIKALRERGGGVPDAIVTLSRQPRK